MLSLYYPPARAYGGPLVSASTLAATLVGQGHEVRVLTTNADGPTGVVTASLAWARDAQGVEVLRCPRVVSEFGAPRMLTELPAAVAWADAVYVWGFFNWLLPAAAFFAGRARRALVVSPRGMLLPEALRTRSARKATFIRLTRSLLPRSTAFHATSTLERDDLARRFPGARVELVPNGVDIPAELPRAPAPTPYLLYLGRLHPHKRLERLLDAFAQVRRATSAAVELIVAGPGPDDYAQGLVSLSARLGLADSVRFVGRVDGEARTRLLAGAEALLLASRSESFGQVVAEALAHATPCVVTRSAPWPGLESHGCGFWVEDADLADALGRMLNQPMNERRAMGLRGRDWMAAEFGWPQVARRIADLLGARP